MIDARASANNPLDSGSGVPGCSEPSGDSNAQGSCGVPATVPRHFSDGSVAVMTKPNSQMQKLSQPVSAQRQGSDNMPQQSNIRRAFALAPLYDKPPNSHASSFVDMSFVSDEAVQPPFSQAHACHHGREATSSSEPSERSGESTSQPSNLSEPPAQSSGQGTTEKVSGGDNPNTGTQGPTASSPHNGTSSSHAPTNVEHGNRRVVVDASPQSTTSGTMMPAFRRDGKESGSSEGQLSSGASNGTLIAAKTSSNTTTSSIHTGTSNGGESRHEHVPLLPLGDASLTNLRRIVVHKDLVGRATYVLFTDFQPPPVCPEPCPPLTRLFMGQLPFRVSPEMIAWLVWRFAQRPVYNIEHDLRIVQTVSRGPVRLPSGCIRASCHDDDAEHIVESIHERLLCDAEGVWMATTPKEVEVIHSYCEHLRSVPHDRARGFPYRVVTVELAKRSHARRLTGPQQMGVGGSAEQNP